MNISANMKVSASKSATFAKRQTVKLSKNPLGVATGSIYKPIAQSTY